MKKVIIIPGCLASTLADSNYGNIWVSPQLYFTRRFSLLRMGNLVEGEIEKDYNNKVSIRAVGPIPFVYDRLIKSLKVKGYEPTFFPVDWRKNMEEAATSLAQILIKEDKINLVAHSQGALVARRAIQIAEAKKVDKLVLVAPANRGSFSAPLSIIGETNLAILRKILKEPTCGFGKVFGSMSGIYQLFPWGLPWLQNNLDISDESFWGNTPGIDLIRLRKFYGWSRRINIDWLNDRTTMILGGNKGENTVGSLQFGEKGRLYPWYYVKGDGTVPHACAVLDGVPTYLDDRVEHTMILTKRNIVRGVIDILDGKNPDLKRISNRVEDWLGRT